VGTLGALGEDLDAFDVDEDDREYVRCRDPRFPMVNWMSAPRQMNKIGTNNGKRGAASVRPTDITKTLLSPSHSKLCITITIAITNMANEMSRNK
jgi:hypothetical protein